MSFGPDFHHFNDTVTFFLNVRLALLGATVYMFTSNFNLLPSIFPIATLDIYQYVLRYLGSHLLQCIIYSLSPCIISSEQPRFSLLQSGNVKMFSHRFARQQILHPLQYGPQNGFLFSVSLAFLYLKYQYKQSLGLNSQIQYASQ